MLVAGAALAAGASQVPRRWCLVLPEGLREHTWAALHPKGRGSSGGCPRVKARGCLSRSRLLSS